MPMEEWKGDRNSAWTIKSIVSGGDGMEAD